MIIDSTLLTPQQRHDIEHKINVLGIKLPLVAGQAGVHWRTCHDIAADAESRPRYSLRKTHPDIEKAILDVASAAKTAGEMDEAAERCGLTPTAARLIVKRSNTDPRQMTLQPPGKVTPHRRRRRQPNRTHRFYSEAEIAIVVQHYPNVTTMKDMLARTRPDVSKAVKSIVRGLKTHGLDLEQERGKIDNTGDTAYKAVITRFRNGDRA